MNTKIILSSIATLGLSVSGAFAAAIASDTAANYAGTWSTTPANLGSGFGAWTITDNNANPPYASTFLDQTSYGNPDTVLTAGYAWGTYANGAANAFINLSRAFNTGGGSASLLDQTFSFAYNSSGIGNAGQFVALNVGTAFNLSYAGGGTDNMTLSVDGGTASAVPVSYAQLAAGVNVAFTVTGPANSTTEGYSLSISPFAGGPALYTGSGTFDSSAYNTSSFTLSDNNTTQNQYFNNLSITAVPEPTTLALAGLGGLATLVAARRRK